MALTSNYSILSRTCSLGVLLLAGLGFVRGASAQSLDRAKLLFAEAKYAEAKTELVAVQRSNARSAETAYYLGRLARIDNDGDEALRQFERAVQLEDGKGLYHYWFGTALSDAAQRASTARMALMARRVRKEWERAVELDPNLVDARFGLVQFYSVAPWFWGGGMDKARVQVAEIAKRNPMRGAMARGVLAEREKKPAAEVDAYQQAVALAPDSIVTYVDLADALVRAGRVADAFGALDSYARRRPNDDWVLFHIGRVVGTSGQQLDRGEGALRQFLAAPPTDAFVPTLALSHYWLGQIAERRGAKEAAREHYRTALKVNPKSMLSKKALETLK